MLSKEEYKRQLVRMWDSKRDDEHKGREDCGGVTCIGCPLYKKACGSFSAFEAVEFVENWAKEHPILTNAMKFKEVFGIEPETQACVIPHIRKCENCEYYIPDDKECGVQAKFWNAEYTEPAESEDK